MFLENKMLKLCRNQSSLFVNVRFEFKRRNKLWQISKCLSHTSAHSISAFQFRLYTITKSHYYADRLLRWEHILKAWYLHSYNLQVFTLILLRFESKFVVWEDIQRKMYLYYISCWFPPRVKRNIWHKHSRKFTGL